MKYIIKNHLLQILISLTFFALLSLGYFIKESDVNVLIIICLSVLNGIFIIINLLTIFLRRDKYLVSKKIMSRFDKTIVKSGKPYFRIIIFLGYSIIFISFMSLFIIGLLVTSYVKTQMAYFIVTLLISLILGTFTYQILPLKKKENKDIYLLNKSEADEFFDLNINSDKVQVYIENNSRLRIYYRHKIEIYFGIEALPFLSQKELKTIYNHEISLIDSSLGKHMLIDAKMVEFFSRFLESNLIFHFLNVIFFEGITFLIKSSFDKLLNEYSNKLEEVKLNKTKELNEEKDFLSTAYKISCLKFVKDLSFPFSIYLNNEKCPHDYYYQKVSYINNFLMENMERINDFVNHYPPYLLRKNSLNYLGEISYDGEINTLHDSIFKYYNNLYYFNHQKGYLDERKEEYTIFQDVIIENFEQETTLTLSAKAYAYLKLNDKSQALKYFNLSLKMDRENAFSLFHKGEILIKDDIEEGLSLVKQAYSINSNYLERSLKLIDKYLIRHHELKEKMDTDLASLNLIKSRLDTNEKSELTSNSKMVIDDLTDKDYQRIINFAKRFPCLKTIKIIKQELKDKNKHYLGLYFDNNYPHLDKKLCFEGFYYLLDNFSLPKKDNNFFLYVLTCLDKKYDIYSSFLNSKNSKIIYNKED